MAKTAHRKSLEESNKAKTAARAELLKTFNRATLKPNALAKLPPSGRKDSGEGAKS